MNNTKALYRSGKNKMIAGVCGGLAEYFDIDPAVIRLIWVLFSFAGGAGVWAYIIAWIIIPENPESRRKEIILNDKVKLEKTKVEKETSEVENKARREKKGYLIGFILVVLGAIFLANNFFPSFRFDKLWPLIVVAVGLAILFSSNRKTQ